MSFLLNTSMSSSSFDPEPLSHLFGSLSAQFIENTSVNNDEELNHYNGTVTDDYYYDGYGTAGDNNEVHVMLGELTTSDLSFALSATTENYVGGGSGDSNIAGSGGNITSGNVDGGGDANGDGVIPEDFWLVFTDKNLRHSIGWTVTLVVAYLLILFIGIIGNFMVILVVLLRPQMRTVTNMFIMNLAVADLFVIVFCVPATLLANVLKRKWGLCFLQDLYLTFRMNLLLIQ